jgi:hypothetical protein
VCLTCRVLMALQQRRQGGVRPVEQLAVQFQSICGFCVIVTLQMQVTQFVYIADIHLFAVYLTVEILYHEKSKKTWLKDYYNLCELSC